MISFSPSHLPFALALPLVVLLVACQGPAAPPQAPPNPSGLPTIPLNPPDTSPILSLTLPNPPATHFVPVKPPAPQFPLPPVSPPIDPCLSEAAALYAAHHPPAPAPEPPLALLEFLLRSSGCLDSSASVRLFYTTEDGTHGIEEHLKTLEEPLRSASFIGIGRAKAPAPYHWTWALLLVDRRFKLTTALPRACAPNERLTAHVEVSESLQNVELIVMDTSLRVTREVVAPQQGTPSTQGLLPYALPIRCSSAPGELWVELLGRGDLGPEVIFQSPIYVGGPLPTHWTGERPQEDPKYTQSPEAAEQHMVTLLNEDRRRHGLAPLVHDPALSQIARLHSEQMRDLRFFAHTSPTSGDLSARLAQARYRVRSSTENIARNTSLTDAQRGLMQSLGHRINILDPAVTHVGIGVAIDTTSPKPILHITQNFAKPLAALTPEAFQAQTLSRIPAHLSPPQALVAIAQRAAAHIEAHGFVPTTLNPLLQQWLSEAQIPYRSFTLQYQTLLEPLDLSIPTGPRSPSAIAIGFTPPDPQGRFPILLIILHS